MKKLNIILSKLMFTLLIIFVISCGEKSKQTQNESWENTTLYQLTNEKIKILLPNKLKRSSRYRLKEDLPFLAKDSLQLRLVQNSLELLEFEDAEIDVFVDTTKSYRMIIICNTQRINFNKSDAAILKKQLEVQNQNSGVKNPNLAFGELKVDMKRNSILKLLRYTTPIKNISNNSKVYNSVYYLTTNTYSLIVYEFCEDEELIEKYLWTTKI